jgi:propanol-preferring alcohol dehydrogenase
MRAVVLDAWGGELSVESVPDPEPGPGEGAVAADGLATPLHVAERAAIDDGETVLEEAAADGTLPDPTLSERLRKATLWSDGPTVAVDTVGDPETLDAAWEALGMGGRLVTLTTHHQRALDMPLAEYVVRERTLLGSRYATSDQVVRAARLQADGRVDAVTNGTVGLAAVPELHERIRAGEGSGAFVLEP